MTLMNLILVLVAVGILLYVVNTFVPIDAKIRKIINVVTVLVVVLWLLDLFGVFGPLSHVRVGR